MIFSKYSPFTVGLLLATSAILGGVVEEAGMRGYLQGTLERAVPAPAAIVIVALVMAPGHALSQGFVWNTVLFYLVVDVVYGTTAYLTQSILPGIAAHAAGLFVFFAFIWPRDEARPVVCVDEGGKQLIGDARPPLPTRPRHPAKEDHEYVRKGTANLFLAFEPLSGWRHVLAPQTLPPPLDLTLYLTVCLEGANEELVFDVAAKEGSTIVRELNWPTAMDARIRRAAERVASKRVRRSVKVDPETVFVRPKSPERGPKSTSGP